MADDVTGPKGKPFSADEVQLREIDRGAEQRSPRVGLVLVGSEGVPAPEAGRRRPFEGEAARWPEQALEPNQPAVDREALRLAVAACRGMALRVCTLLEGRPERADRAEEEDGECRPDLLTNLVRLAASGDFLLTGTAQGTADCYVAGLVRKWHARFDDLTWLFAAFFALSAERV